MRRRPRYGGVRRSARWAGGWLMLWLVGIAQAQTPDTIFAPDDDPVGPVETTPAAPAHAAEDGGIPEDAGSAAAGLPTAVMPTDEAPMAAPPTEAPTTDESSRTDLRTAHATTTEPSAAEPPTTEPPAAKPPAPPVHVAAGEAARADLPASEPVEVSPADSATFAGPPAKAASAAAAVTAPPTAEPPAPPVDVAAGEPAHVDLPASEPLDASAADDPMPARPPAEAGSAAAAAAAAATAPPPVELSIPPASTLPPELLAEADPDAPAFIGPRLMPTFAILDQQVLSGAKARLEWSASQSFAGAEVLSPVFVLHGVRPGPVLCLTGAVHGDELNGVEIVRRLTRAVDPERLSGTLIAVPIVNLFGFSRNSRYLPDRRDLNRYFPGSERGSIASRIAHSFFRQVVSHCDALVDFHTGSFDRANLPQVRADLRLPHVLRFARGFGAVPVLHSAGSRGMLRLAATQAGIPAVTFEVGAPAVLEPVEIAAGVRAIEALMHYLGMTAVAPGEQEPQAIFYDSVWVRANAGGMLIGAVALGDRVAPGQKLGTVVDPINDIERDIMSPVYGRVIGIARNQVVLPGFAAYHLGEETSEARAVREAAAGLGVEEPVEEDPDPGAHEDGVGDGADRAIEDGEPIDD